MRGLKLPLCLAGATACITTSLLSAFSICITGEILIESYVTRLAIAAAALDMMMMMFLVASIWLVIVNRSLDWLALLFRVLGLAVWFSGNVISLIVFGFTLAASKSGGRHSSASYNIAVAGLTIGIIGLFPQATFIILISPRMEGGRVALSNVMEAQQLPARSTKQDDLFRSVPLTKISTATDMVVSEVSPRSVMEWPTSPTSLIRDSICRVIRPITSRTNLISTRSSTPRESYSLHIERNVPTDIARHDGFDSWDTSSVEERFGFSGRTNHQPSRPALEPIPGSRPLSLINTLDSSYEELDIMPSRKDQETPLPDSPTYSAVSPISQESFLSTSMQPRLDQSNIHPLFRTESPGPRPVATPGTVIVASPHAGQVVGPDHSLSPRKASFSTSRAPSPAVFSQADGGRNFRSFRFPASSGDEEPRRSGSQLSKVSFVDGDS